GRVRYQGGEPLAKLALPAGRMTPEEFRLSADSAGSRAGKDGKDLGADVDLVGPGKAYERWKKTPEHQQWLKDSGQLRADVSREEPGAFVLLGGRGIEVGKFDTLAGAISSAGAGDTVEVRGNGPFDTDPIKTTRALVVRAGGGFVPV